MSDLVIFDCDGVLVDSELIFARVLAECLGGLDFPATLDDAIALGFGRNRVTLAAAIATRYGRALPEAFFDTFAALSAAAFERELLPMPGIEELLAAKGFAWERLDVGGDEATLDFVTRQAGCKPDELPVVFVADRAVGGYEALVRADVSGELARLVLGS